MTTPPSYLTDHGDAVEEIGTLAHLLARLVHFANTEPPADRLTHLELTVLAAQAAQRPQCSAPQPAPTGIRSEPGESVKRWLAGRVADPRLPTQRDRREASRR